MPGGTKNIGLFSRSVFTAMKRTAFFINIGRGETVDEAALYEVLREQRIAGAGLDVFHAEPLPAGSPFWDMPKVFLTPHIGGFFAEYDEYVMPILSGSEQAFWSGLADIIRDLGPGNRALLVRRNALQKQIDAWHLDHQGRPIDQREYEGFLRESGYLLPETDNFAIRTDNVDDELAHVAGPQLVVPLSNARYALNAANARWGSLYDALYGTDAIPDDGDALRGEVYNPLRGARVIERARMLLDVAAPLQQGSHRASTSYLFSDGKLLVTLSDGTQSPLARPEQFIGYRGEEDLPSAILLCNHGLRIEIAIDPPRRVAQHNPTGISDIILESAITTIMDLEDSVAVVDADDKVGVYRNWLGLMNGTLTASFSKGG